MEIEALNLPIKIEHALKRHGILTIEKLQTLSREDLMMIRLIGTKAYDTIIESLNAYEGIYDRDMPPSKEEENISLYECANAHVTTDGKRIICKKNHRLGETPDGSLPINLLEQGKSLIFPACQNCNDLNIMGGYIPPTERGWKSKVRLLK